MEKLTIRNLLRLFYRFMVDFVPIVNRSGELKGVLLKSKVISLTGGDLKDLDRPVTKDFVFTLLSDSSEAKPFWTALMDRNEVKIPVVTEEGELYGFWNRGELFDAFGGKKILPLSIVNLLLERFPFAIGIFNDKGDPMYFNSLFKEAFDNEVGRNWHLTKLREFNYTSPESIEFSLGNRKWSGMLIPLYEGERLSGVAFVWEDVSELERVFKRAAQLAAFQRSFEMVFSSIEEGFWCVDRSGKVLFCNPSFERIYGVESIIGRRAEEVFGDIWRSFPIFKSMEIGEEVFEDEHVEEVLGKKLCLSRRAIPVILEDRITGAVEIIRAKPLSDWSEIGEWLELGEISRMAFEEGSRSITEGSLFIWGPPGVGKTLLGVSLLRGFRNVVLINGGLPRDIPDDAVVFVENFDSLSEEEKVKLYEMIKSRRSRSVVTSRLPLNCCFPLSRELFKSIIYLPPVSERWDEVKRFLSLKYERFREEERDKVLAHLREMDFKENFRGILKFLDRVFSPGHSLKDLLGNHLNLREFLENKERELVLEVFSLCGGNVTKAAKMLGVPRQTLQYKLKKFNIRGLD